MCVCFIRTCVLFLSVSFVYSEVTIENGVHNVLVAFSQNVPAEIGTEIIKEMQTALRRASEILQDAVGLQFSKVIFEVPESWEIPEYDDIKVNESFKGVAVKADILIDNTNDTVFGKFPFAQQYGSCGIPGYQIIVPTAFFDELNEFPKGIALAREWLKYQFGVFDENGYVDDQLYPLYYYTPGGDPNEVHITECINSEVTYNFTDEEGHECPANKMLIDQLNSGKCVFNINEEDLENVHSSLMYFHDNVKNMTNVCGKDNDHPHNARARNKQNVLCDGKSIWDVVRNSSNFNKGDEEHADIEFFIKKKAKLINVVVAWENTARMKNQSKIILDAMKKLMIDLPDGSKFSAFPFEADEVDGDYPLKELDNVNTRKLIALLDLKSDFVDDKDGNIKKAIQKAISILRGATESSGESKDNIIIITGSPDDLIVALFKDVSDCIKTLEEDINKISQQISENTDELLSSLPCLEVIRIPSSDKPEEFYKKLVGAVEETCPSKAEDKLTEMVKAQFIDQTNALDFEIDDLTETIMLTIFTDKQSKNFKLEKEGVKIEGGKWEDYGDVLQLSYSLTEAGAFKLLYFYETDPMLVEIKKTSKAGKYFSANVMFLDTTAESDKHQMPVIIYTSVRFGSYPVQNARAMAIIQRPDGTNINLILKDDGIGDPDITRGDGVYSRYFINFNGTGEYILKVVVVIKRSEATYGVDGNAGYRSCCGSVLEEGTTIESQFQKIYKTTFTTKLDRPEDGYKPSRITDLRIQSATDDGIVLTWSAPGEEADTGMVESYEIKSFTSPEEAKNNFDDGGSLLDYTLPPKERGETQELNISYNDFENHGLHYIAIKAKNSNSNKKSDLSTIVEVYISNTETTDAPDNGGDGSGKIKTGKTSPKTIGLIVGLIVGLIILMILIYIVIYFVIVKPKRKKQQKTKKEEKKEDRENPIYDHPKRTENKEMNPINFVSADTLIKHHNEKLKAKTENKKPPIFKEEDFENRNFQSTNESSVSSNDQDQESSNKTPRNGQPFPPKSPKRITPV